MITVKREKSVPVCVRIMCLQTETIVAVKTLEKSRGFLVCAPKEEGAGWCKYTDWLSLVWRSTCGWWDNEQKRLKG